MSKFLAFLKKIRDILRNEEEDAETFFINAARYAARNIKAELLKVVADCAASAEEAAIDVATGQLDKAVFAFGNIVAACEREGIAFTIADIKYATEAVIQRRNAEAAAAQAAEETAPTPPPAA